VKLSFSFLQQEAKHSEASNSSDRRNAKQCLMVCSLLVSGTGMFLCRCAPDVFVCQNQMVLVENPDSICLETFNWSAQRYVPLPARILCDWTFQSET
jgi:hypothetical protein